MIPRRRLSLPQIGTVVGRAVIAWFEDDAPSMGAAIAFYTLFAIAPILFIFIRVAGSVFSPEVVQQHILEQLRMLLGSDAAEAVRTLLKSSKYGENSDASTVAGIVALCIAATSVFAELQNALHRIWRTPVRSVVQGLWHAVRARLLSFGLVFGIGFLLLVSLLMSAGLEGLGSWLGPFTVEWQPLALSANALLGLAIATVLFTMIFRYVPRERAAWGDVWLGGFVTAVLFTAGKWGIVVYLGKLAIASSYGIAGSFFVLLLWVYYSAQIFLFGAEFTYRFALARGLSAPPSSSSVGT